MCEAPRECCASGAQGGTVEVHAGGWRQTISEDTVQGQWEEAEAGKAAGRDVQETHMLGRWQE